MKGWMERQTRKEGEDAYYEYWKEEKVITGDERFTRRDGVRKRSIGR